VRVPVIEQVAVTAVGTWAALDARPSLANSLLVRDRTVDAPAADFVSWLRLEHRARRAGPTLHRQLPLTPMRSSILFVARCFACRAGSIGQLGSVARAASNSDALGNDLGMPLLSSLGQRFSVPIAPELAARCALFEA
jgi:hypothetical protein